MYTNKIDASVNNIPASFGTGAGSQIIAAAPSGGDLTIINTTDSILYVVWLKYNPGAAAPSSALPGTCMSVPAAPTSGTGFGTFTGKITMGDTVFIRTDASSSRTTGVVVASIL